MFSRFLNGLEEGVISLLLASMTLLVFVEVVLRICGTGLMWAQDLTLHLSAWMVMFGASYGLKVGSHIGVDAVIRLLPRTARRIVSAFATILGMVYCGLFSYGAWIYLKKMHLIGIEMEDMPIPRWIAHSILLIGFALLFLRLAQLLFAIVTDRAEGFKMVDEAKESMHLVEETRQHSEGDEAR